MLKLPRLVPGAVASGESVICWVTPDHHCRVLLCDLPQRVCTQAAQVWLLGRPLIDFCRQAVP